MRGIPLSFTTLVVVCFYILTHIDVGLGILALLSTAHLLSVAWDKDDARKSTTHP